MMLFSGPVRNERQHRASVLLSAGLLLLVFATVCGSLPASSTCPHRIDCVLMNRRPCRPGSARCGSCLDGFRENERRRCSSVELEQTRHHRKAKVLSYHDLQDEEEIDSVVEKEQTLPKQSMSPDISSSSSQTGVEIRTDASEQKPQSQRRSSSEVLSTQNTTTTTTTTTIKPPTPTPLPRAGQPIAIPVIKKDGIVVILISVCILLGAVITAAVCGIRLQRKAHLARKVDYPAFGGGDKPPPKPPADSNGTSVGDTTLAQNVQMYHYQHQKQQMMSMGKHKEEQKIPESEGTSDEEEMGGDDFTVYECPGLAPTGEMEVKNPLFDDSTLHYQENHK